MTQIGTLKAGLTATVKFLIPATSPILLAATSLIDESTMVPLTIVGSVGGAAWYLNGRLTKIEDALAVLKEESDRAREHHSQLCPLMKSDKDSDKA